MEKPQHVHGHPRTVSRLLSHLSYSSQANQSTTLLDWPVKFAMAALAGSVSVELPGDELTMLWSRCCIIITPGNQFASCLQMVMHVTNNIQCSYEKPGKKV